jgi:Tfp pilus assembly protein PilV
VERVHLRFIKRAQLLAINMSYRKQKKQKGFSVLEIIIAAAAFMLFATAAIGIFTQGLGMNRFSGEQVIANSIIAEGLDAARSIRDSGFNNLTITSPGTTGIDRSSGLWQYNGASSNLINNKYTRKLKVETVNRDSVTKEIVPTGGVLDPNTKKVTSTVEWQLGGRTVTHSSFLYLSDFQKTLPACDDRIDNDSDGKIDYLIDPGCWGYADNDEYNSSGGGGGGGGTPTYVCSDGQDNDGDLLVDYPTDPGCTDPYDSDEYNTPQGSVCSTWSRTPTIEAKHNIEGDEDGIKVAIEGNYAYVIRTDRASGNSLLSVVDISNSQPQNVVSVFVEGRATNIFVRNSIAYITSASPTEELHIFDLSNPASPTKISDPYNNPNPISGDSQANDIWVDASNQYAYLVKSQDTTGTGGSQFYVLDVSAPNNIYTVIEFALTGDILSISVDGNYAFAISNDPNSEINTIDISSPNGSYFMMSTDIQNVSGALASVIDNLHILAVGSFDGYIHYFDVTNPSSGITWSSDFQIGGQVNDLARHDTEQCTFVATNTSYQYDPSGEEFFVVDYSDPINPIKATSKTIGYPQNGLDYSSSYSKIISVGDDDMGEITSITP